jgi:phosphate/sulfate permease
MEHQVSIGTKAVEVGYALLFSPIIGFVCAAILLLLMKFVIRKPELYAAPKGFTELRTKLACSV